MSCKEEKTCEELSEGGENSTVCYDENIGACTTDTEEYLDVACTVKLECDGIDRPTEAQLNDCKATMHGDKNILRCFRAAKLQEAVECIKTAECTPDPVRNCVEVQGSIGSEILFAFFTYARLKSGNWADYSFQFPVMKWNITVRYQLL